MFVYQCEDSFENILTGIYDAWASGHGHDNIRLEVMNSSGSQPMLFDEPVTVYTDAEKADKVASSIRRKISPEAYQWVYRASLSASCDKADVIYRFLTVGYKLGASATTALAYPQVLNLFELNRAVANEGHLSLEFLRFTILPNGVLAARIQPKNHILSLIMPHFADRLNTEHFLIYDVGRKVAGVYQPDSGWFLTDIELDEHLFDGGGLQNSNQGVSYEALWKTFFDTIAIKERINPVCQRNHLPLHFRPHMTEFES